MTPVVYACPVAECDVTEPHRPDHYIHRGLDLAGYGNRSGPAPRCAEANLYLAERGLSWYYKALAACSAAAEPGEPCQVTDPEHRHAGVSDA